MHIYELTPCLPNLQNMLNLQFQAFCEFEAFLYQHQATVNYFCNTSPYGIHIAQYDHHFLIPQSGTAPSLHMMLHCQTLSTCLILPAHRTDSIGTLGTHPRQPSSRAQNDDLLVLPQIAQIAQPHEAPPSFLS